MGCTDKPPKVSVISGVYNIGSLSVFPLAAESVLAQTAGDFEWILCDDGSTDNTREILDELAKADSRIRVIGNAANKGLAESLNHCLAHARGELIARQDADDLSAADRFRKQIEYLEANPQIGFVGSNVALWDHTGRYGKRVFPEFPQPKDFLFTQPFVHGALMFRRSALEAAGGYRAAKETLRAEDYEMLMRMYAAGIRGANIQEELYFFKEDEATQRRRKYRYRLDEAAVRWRGFQEIGLMPGALPYVAKPLVVGLIPVKLLKKLKKLREY